MLLTTTLELARMDAQERYQNLLKESQLQLLLAEPYGTNPKEGKKLLERIKERLLCLPQQLKEIAGLPAKPLNRHIVAANGGK